MMSKRHSNHVGNPESLFVRLEELVVANSGADPFEAVFQLVVAKLWDERNGSPGRFKPAEFVALLREAEKGWPGILEPGSRPTLTPEHLHVCVEALARHTISDASLSVMDSFFEFLVSRGAKGAKGQYFTPRHVIEFCVRLLRPMPAETVLDPACGSGGFLLHALDHIRREHGLTGAKAVQDYCANQLWGFEIDLRALRVAKAMMILAGGRGNIIRLNSLWKPAQGRPPCEDESGLTIEDVCRTRMRPFKGFDVILTNPPFAGEIREPRILESYTLSRGRRWIERDVLFLERCVELLRPGGRLAIILPHNKFAMGAWAGARTWLLQNVRVLAVVGLGRHTFLPHTHQKAGILFAQKYGKGVSPAPDQKVFFGISERDGKDSKGRLLARSDANVQDSPWDRVDHDLADIVGAFHRFRRQDPLFVEAQPWP
jgi:type I restriction enzyme M protein